MNKLGILVMSATLFVSATATADDAKISGVTAPSVTTSSSAAPGGAKYGPAGCGLGSMLFSPDSGILQIFAATTNGTSANQTFGITSGTSNCDSGAGGQKSAKAFIQTNREALAKDIARGSGETIASLAQVAHCGNAASVGGSLQRSFPVIFPAASVSDEQVAENVVSALRADTSLSCSI